MKKPGVVICVCILLAITFLSGCIEQPKELTQLSIASFDVEPDIITQGETANLSWVVMNASLVNIDNGIGNIALTGYRIIQPTQTTTYTLTASNVTTTKNATVTITVKNESHEPVPSGDTFFTITVGSQSYTYEIYNITVLGAVTGQGAYINKAGNITGPNNYTGVPLSVLLNTLPNLPDTYTVHAIASDGYSRTFSMEEINGHVLVYSKTGGEAGIQDLTMIIAYKENGILLNETSDGPLRIAFISPHSYITSSGLWVSSLVKIELL